MHSNLSYEELIEEINKLRSQLLSNQKSEEYFMELVKNNTDAFSVIDKNGINVYQSDSNATILGYTPEERKNRNAFELMLPEDRQRLQQEFFLNLSNFGMTQKISFRAYHRDGTIRYLEGTAKNMLHSPLINGIIVNYRDVTERVKAEQALKENEEKLKVLNQTKDKLFSIIAHDLRSPFNALLGLLQLLNENFEDYDKNEQKNIIDTIYQVQKNTYALLENLLLWSQSQLDGIIYRPEKLNLISFSNEVVDTLKYSALCKSIEISNQINENIHIMADKNMLSAIFRNLISNAIKFTPRNGKIILETSVPTDEFDESINISVIDNGVGIPKELQEKLFMFWGNTSTRGTENEAGSGLGLAICYEFIKKNGGKIWVESEEGQGSKFVFTLPLAKD